MWKFLTTPMRGGERIEMLPAFVKKAGFIFGGFCRATLGHGIISSTSAATFISSINPREVIKLNDPRSLDHPARKCLFIPAPFDENESFCGRVLHISLDSKKRMPCSCIARTCIIVSRFLNVSWFLFITTINFKDKFEFSTSVKIYNIYIIFFERN